mgnify:CR=1 FL=1
MISLAALFLLCALLLGLPIAHGFTFRQKIVSHQSSAPRTSPFVAASSKTTYSHKFHHDNVLTLYMSDASLDNGASPSMTSSSLTTQLNTAATTQEENLTADSFLQDDLLLIENAKTSTWNWGINILRKDEVKNVNEIVNTSIVVLLSVIILAKLAMVDVGMTRGWTSEELAARMAIDNWDGYLHVLRSSPIATKAVTSATVYTIGDIMAQRTEGASMGDLDRPRILRSMLAGFIGHGPLSHFWYEISENFFDHVAHLTQWWSFIPKVIVDQSIWGPIWCVQEPYIAICDVTKSLSFLILLSFL